MEYRERMIENAREICGRSAPEAEVLEKAIYYATKWTGLSDEEARRIFIDNEPEKIVTLDDLSPRSREWLLEFDKKAAAARGAEPAKTRAS